jgi:streptogramin lyase
MKRLFAFRMVPAVWILSAVAAYAAGEQKKAPAPVAPAKGIKTPGAQIPFASLKPEMEYEGNMPGWIAVVDTVALPNAAKDGLVRIDARAKEKKLADPVTGVSEPCGGAVNAFGSVWTGACGAKSIVRIDAKTAKVTATLPVGIGPARIGIAANADSVWAITDARGTLSRIDPQQNAVVAEFRVPADCGSLTFGETALWLACPAENRVLRVDPQTNVVDKSIEVGAQPEALVIGEGSVWVLCAKDGKIDRIDPKTNKVSKTIELGAAAAGGSLAMGEGSIWVSMPGFPLTRVDPQGEKVVQQFYGAGNGAVQAGMGSVWLVNSGKVLRLDPKRIAATLAE